MASMAIRSPVICSVVTSVGTSVVTSMISVMVVSIELLLQDAAIGRHDSTRIHSPSSDEHGDVDDLMQQHGPSVAFAQ